MIFLNFSIDLVARLVVVKRGFTCLPLFLCFSCKTVPFTKIAIKSSLGGLPYLICSWHCSLVTLFQLNSVSYRDFLGCMWLTLSTMVWWHPFLLFCIYTRLLTAYHSASLLVAYTPQEKNPPRLPLFLCFYCKYYYITSNITSSNHVTSSFHYSLRMLETL